jgi:hypothetical protein
MTEGLKYCVGDLWKLSTRVIDKYTYGAIVNPECTPWPEEGWPKMCVRGGVALNFTRCQKKTYTLNGLILVQKDFVYTLHYI